MMAGIQKKIEAFIPEIASLAGLHISEDSFNYCAIRIAEANTQRIVRKPFDINRDPNVASGGVLNWHLDHFS
jgi:hypothetical protein